jgi:hypothetical protein
VHVYDAHLATQTLTGANRNFALTSILHLAELLTQGCTGRTSWPTPMRSVSGTGERQAWTA